MRRAGRRSFVGALMYNLYSITAKQAAIIALFRVVTVGWIFIQGRAATRCSNHETRCGEARTRDDAAHQMFESKGDFRYRSIKSLARQCRRGRANRCSGGT